MRSVVQLYPGPFNNALIQERIDAHVRKKQRASGHKGKGVRRDRYNGKSIPSPETLLGGVERMHADERYRPRSFNWVCNEVAKAYGYKSAGRVKSFSEHEKATFEKVRKEVATRLRKVRGDLSEESFQSLVEKVTRHHPGGGRL